MLRGNRKLAIAIDRNRGVDFNDYLRHERCAVVMNRRNQLSDDPSKFWIPNQVFMKMMEEVDIQAEHQVFSRLHRV